MSFTEDLTPFFYDYGIAATVGGVALRGIFDNAYATLLGFTAGTQPVLIIKAADAPSVAQGSAVAILTANYTVTGVEPDGTGIVLLRLQEA